MKHSIFQIKGLRIVINRSIEQKGYSRKLTGAHSWHDTFDVHAGLDLTACSATLMSQIFLRPSMHRNLFYCRVMLRAGKRRSLRLHRNQSRN